MSLSAAVETSGLSKAYDGKTVVDNLRLRIAEGEIFGLLGPNGAGKTTTILMLLGLTEPTSGTASIYGHNPTREPLQVKRLIGYLPENVGFYDNLTARENLQFIAELNGIGEAEADARVTELLDAVGLHDVNDLVVGKYSKGMKQRLGIADVLIKRPKVAILDEPTAGLDPEGINQVLDLITGLPEKGAMVILSSHQLYQVQKICHRVGIMSQGKLVVEGALDELGKKVGGGTRYQIEVETTEPGIRAIAIIKKVKGVIRVETKGNMLLIGTNSDLRAEISKAMVNNNLPLIQMRIQTLTLDDIYMRYFKEG
ncbi:MAG TPA: ABC transporter ATP-binding protein [Dehalococcoidia bacterium]|nr:ABC transporter ATP-binding protein [Dehalococcoidia bacterium]